MVTDNHYRKLEIIVNFDGKQMASLTSDKKIPIDTNFTVELETLIIRMGKIIQSAMEQTGVTEEQLKKKLTKDQYKYYGTCRSTLKVIVKHGLPLLAVNAENVLPHQVKKIFDGMCVTIQQHLDNLIRLNKLTPNSVGTKDLKTFE